MSKAKNGDTVRVHYTGRVKDGEVFDSSINDGEPFEFTLGEGRIIPAFEKAIVGMKVGERKTFDLSADQAFGQPRLENVVQVDRKSFPPDAYLEVGQQLFMNTPAGTIPVTIVELNEEIVRLDANHPLAGKDLIFEIELVEIAVPALTQ